MALNRMRFMNTYVDNVSQNEALEYIDCCIRERKIAHVISLNTDEIVLLEKNAYYREIVESADLILTDSQPPLWIAQWYKTPIKEKIAGSDFTPILCQAAAEKGYSVFFLGAAPGVAAIAVEKLRMQIPKLIVGGTYSPPYGFEHDTKEIEKINRMLYESNADLLFVGLGVPKQDIFIHENMRKYKIPVSMAIGATIDFIAGEQKRAPKWMTNRGWECIYRFLHEPKRLFKRYVLEDTKIVWLAWKYRPR